MTTNTSASSSSTCAQEREGLRLRLRSACESTYHLHVVQDALRLAAGQHLAADEVHQRGLGLADVLDYLLVDPRPDLLLHERAVDLRRVQLELEQLLLLRGDLVDETLDVFPLLLGGLALLRAALAPSALVRSVGLLALVFLVFTCGSVRYIR